MGTISLSRLIDGMTRRRHCRVAVWITLFVAMLARITVADDGQGLAWIESHPGDIAPNIITRSQLAISDDGAWLAVCREREQSVLLFQRDRASGRLTRRGQYDLLQWRVRPRCIAIAPGTRRCLVGCDDGSLFSLDIDDGEGHLRGPNPAQWSRYSRTRRVPLPEIVGLAPFDDGRRVGAIDNSSGAIGLFEFDVWFGSERTARVFQDRKFGLLAKENALPLAQPIDGTLTATGLAITPRGNQAIVTSRRLNSVTVFQIDGESRGLTRVATVSYDEVKRAGCRALGSPHALAISPDAKHVYVVGEVANLACLAMPNLAVVSSMNPWQDPLAKQVLATPIRVTVSPDGSRVFVVCQADDSIAVFRRDPANGALTYESSARNNANGITGLRTLSWCVVSPDGKHLYATGAESIVVALAVQ